MTTTTLADPGDGDETAKIIDLGQHRPILAGSETEPAGDVEIDLDEVDDGETFLMSDGQVIDPADLDGSSVDRQIIADWLRDRTAFAEVATDAVKRVFRSIAFHLVRLPLYWLRLTLRGWIGARRAVARRTIGRRIRRSTRTGKQCGSPVEATSTNSGLITRPRSVNGC